MQVYDATVVGVYVPTVTHAGNAYDARTVSPVMTRDERLYALRGRGLPDGIADAVCTSCEHFARRFWILDNSGSMQTADGTRLVRSRNKEGFATSSRWEELCDSVRVHADVAALCRAPTEFLCLNPPANAPQRCEVGCAPDSSRELDAVRAICASDPRGMTPLCAAIRSVVAQIRALEPMLRATGRQAMFVIASDGEPSDGSVANELRALNSLPVMTIIRLCTDDQQMTDFWERIDKDLEGNLDILDDLSSESREIAGVCPYLTYGLPLHHLREWGCHSTLLDILDEKPLTKSQLAQLAVLVIGQRAADLPSPELDWRAFLTALNTAQADNTVFSPTRKNLQPWFDIKKVNAAYGGSQACLLS